MSKKKPVGDEDGLTPEGIHVRNVFRDGNPVMEPASYVPCARDHGDGRICIRKNGHPWFSEQDLLDLDLEYKLTAAHRIDCECGPYLMRRREVLIPAIIAQALNKETDIVEFFHAFQMRLHAERCKGFTAGRFAALMGLVAERENDDHTD